ncbi:MAG: hypothetical protein WCK36_00225 [Candidatus Firestonebacteria bacterium]
MEPVNNYSKEKVLEIFDIMNSIETELAALYTVYAERFPEESAFWSKISQDENNHGENVKKMKKLVLSDDFVYKIEKTFTPKAGILMLQNIKLNIKNVLEQPVSIKQAFVIARDLENSLFESKYMEFLITNNKEFNNLIDINISQTAAHKALIESKAKSLSPK